MQIVVPPGAPKKGNLVARLKGTGAKKPLLLLAQSTWWKPSARLGTLDPFKLVEEGGYFYGARLSRTTRPWRRSSSPT